MTDGLYSEYKFYKAALTNKDLEHKVTDDSTVTYIIDKSSSKVIFVAESQHNEGVLNTLINNDCSELFY